MSLALRASLLLLHAFLGLVAAYQALLALAAHRPRPRLSPESPPASRIAVVIPAHDEEACMGRVLAGVFASDYPRDLFDVHVIADNCSDSTAGVARSWGATVHERCEPEAPGKGAALAWLVERLPLDCYDGLLFVDADAVVSAGLLRVADAYLRAGEDAVQFHDGVLNRDDSPVAGLRALAFDLRNFVQPLGREALGLSAGIMGNGFLLSTRLLAATGWPGRGLTEDASMHLALVRSGRRVRFAPEASCLAEMPASLAESTGQNLRWERGRLGLALSEAPRLLREGLERRDPVRLGAALDLMAPPQSVQLAGALTSGVAGVVLGSRALVFGGAVLVGVQSLYVAVGMLRLPAETRSFRLLTHLPRFAAWKSLIYARAVAGQGDGRWERGPRRAGVDAGGEPAGREETAAPRNSRAHAGAAPK